MLHRLHAARCRSRSRLPAELLHRRHHTYILIVLQPAHSRPSPLRSLFDTTSPTPVITITLSNACFPRSKLSLTYDPSHRTVLLGSLVHTHYFAAEMKRAGHSSQSGQLSYEVGNQVLNRKKHQCWGVRDGIRPPREELGPLPRGVRALPSVDIDMDSCRRRRQED